MEEVVARPRQSSPIDGDVSNDPFINTSLKCLNGFHLTNSFWQLKSMVAFHQKLFMVRTLVTCNAILYKIGNKFDRQQAVAYLVKTQLANNNYNFRLFHKCCLTSIFNLILNIPYLKGIRKLQTKIE
jgi:hypothetical protein